MAIQGEEPALSIRSVVSKPIKFISTGEKMDAIDIFYPVRMADRILGMGDIVSLVEKLRSNMMLKRPGSFRKNCQGPV